MIDYNILTVYLINFNIIICRLADEQEMKRLKNSADQMRKSMLQFKIN